jgi:Domain of unknown function (DUF4337)
MEELEAPTEQLQEEIHHHAHSANESWQMKVALTSTLLAVFAALAAMLGGKDANEAMVEQIQSSDKWSYYQAKSIKAAMQKSQIRLLETLGKGGEGQKFEEELKRYEKDMEEIKHEAEEKAEKSVRLLERHEHYAFALTFFQVGIGIAAISVLIRRKSFWKISVGLGLVGLGLFIWGMLTRI